MDDRQWRTTGRFLIASGVVFMLVGAGLLWMVPLEQPRQTPGGVGASVPDDPYADAGRVIALVGVILVAGGIVPVSTHRRSTERAGPR